MCQCLALPRGVVPSASSSSNISSSKPSSSAKRLVAADEGHARPSDPAVARAIPLAAEAAAGRQGLADALPEVAKGLRLAKRHGEARIHQADADRQRHLLQPRHDRRDVAARRQRPCLQPAQGLAARRRRPPPSSRGAASRSRRGRRRSRDRWRARPASADRSGRGRPAACGAADGRAVSRSRRPSRPICLPSCARLRRPALVALPLRVIVSHPPTRIRSRSGRN